MDITTATNISKWLEGLPKRYIAHIKSHPRNNIPVTSTRWRTPGYAHSSSLSDCPKKVAVKDRELLEEQFSLYTELRMEEGTQMGNLIAEAIAWGVEELNRSYSEAGLNVEYSIDLEERLKIDSPVKLAGQLDVTIYRFDGSNGTYDCFPVEVKLTTGNRFRYNLKFWLQTCAYMTLLRKNNPEYNCSFGYTLVMYDGWRPGEEPLKVFMTEFNESNQAFYLHSDENSYIMVSDRTVDIPETFVENGEYVLTQTRLDRLIWEQNSWYEKIESDIIPDDKPFSAPWSMEATCGYRHFNRSNKSQIPNKLSGLCPLFSTCWVDQLKKSGIDVDNVPDSLVVEQENNGIILRSDSNVSEKF